MNNKVIFLLAVARLFGVWLGLLVLSSPVVSFAIKASAQDAFPTSTEIDRSILALDNDDSLTDEERSQTLDTLQEARGLIRSAAAQTDVVNGFTAVAATSSEIVAQLEQELSVTLAAEAPAELPETSAGLRSRLSFLQSERAVLAEQRAELLVERTALANRPALIAEELSTARQALAELLQRPAEAEQEGQSPIEGARRTLLLSRIFARETEIGNLQRELQSIPERQPIISARLAVINARIDTLDAQISAIQGRLSDVRMDRADAALERAESDLETTSELPDSVTAIAEENVRLASRLKTMADNALQIEQDINTLTQQTQQIQQQSETVERILATGRVTEEIGALLRQLRSSLPNAAALRAAIADSVEARASMQLNLVLWQDQLRSLRSALPADALLQSVELSSSDETVSDSHGAAIEPLAENRARLLTDLVAAGRAQSDRLTEKEIKVQETLAEAQALRGTLDRRLLWLPSNIRPLRSWIGNASTALSWISSAPVLREAGQDYLTAVETHSAALLLVAALALLLVLMRGRLRDVIHELNDSVGKVARDRYLTTPLALLALLGLALPVPLLLAGFAAPSLLVDEASPLLRGVASGMLAIATLALLILYARSASRPEGVLATHFNWTEKAISLLRSPPLLFVMTLCLAVFVLIASLASGRTDAQNSIGMAAFMVASLGFAVLGYGAFRFEKGLVRLTVSEGMSAVFTLLGLLFLAAAPLLIGFLPLLGYFDTAVALQTRVLQTTALLLAIAILYGVLRRLLLIAQRRLALRKALDRRARLVAERAQRAELGEDDEDHEDDMSEMMSEPEELEEERERISNQTRRVLLYLAAAGGIAFLLTVWADILPALGIANEITLWTGYSTLDGNRIERPVTLWNLILFGVFIVGGFVAAYNIRGVLEVGPFQRLALSTGSRYAIDAIVGYLLVGAGIIAGFLQLGLDWSRLQWIIAALGVGLGFGLQEIVANFISGLIILFERPVRVGDTVTIGELEGNVTNIAIRATTIRDFDNLEVLLPNKSIITENVINWTLRDSVMRIIVPIGVAYGSDVDAVRAILMKIADDENDVLDSPEPRVFFMEHGDSSLDFEVRVFISNPRKRFRVRHELNTAINKALTNAGIEIPFPQRDIHMR